MFRHPLLASLLLFCVLSVPPPAWAGLQITEFLADNEDSIADDDGDREDWIEITNTGTAAVDLHGWRLTDDASSPSKWVFPSVSIPAAGRLMVWASEKDHRDPDHPLHTNFKLAKSGEYLGLLRPNGTVEHDYAPAYPPQYEDVSYGLAQGSTPVLFISGRDPADLTNRPGAPARWKVPSDASEDAFDASGQALPNSWINTNFDDQTDQTWTAATTGIGYDRSTTVVNFLPHIGTGGNCEAALFSVRQSIYIRIPFTVTNPAEVGALTLRMKYDDGFAAFLNGVPVKVANANDPAVLTWQAGAPVQHVDPAAVLYVDFPISNPQSVLQTGANVLCIHGLNNGAPSSDFLICPELSGVIYSGLTTAQYFPAPTPDAVNSSGVLNPGPLVEEVPETLPMLTAGAPNLIPVTARVSRTVNPISSVDLKYRIMYNAETSVPMTDNGTGGDATAGDGIYTGVMNASTITAGQMLRWRVIAGDTAVTSGRSPAFALPNDSPEYFGTIAADPTVDNSRIPVMHSFLPSGGNPDSATGSRCSIYYQDAPEAVSGLRPPGEFYDNIGMNIHGQSTQSFVKKSYDVDFNHDYRFRYQQGEGRVKDINLLTSWADKSRVRNTLAWETFRVTGSLGLFSIPVRVNRNGTFFTLSDMVEDGDDRYLERVGLDPEGPLYKMYNILDNATSNVEKKTRKWDNNNDLQALINGLNPATAIATRRLYGYDNVDLPIVINYLACNELINNTDTGHKNYYLYRDTNGTGEWKMLAWDSDLSLGHTWTSAKNYFDDNIDSQRPLRNGATNRLKQLIYDAPELNRLFVRRIRTLMDQMYLSSTSTTGYYETRIAQVLDLLDPPGLGALSDGNRDFQRWGFWLDAGGGAAIAASDPRSVDHTPRATSVRLLSANPVPPYVGAAGYANYGNDSRPPFLPGRRSYLYGPNARSGTEPIPAGQTALPALIFGAVEHMPANGEQEYLTIINSTPDAVDISGWKLTGGIDFTFRGGTVIPSGGGATQNVGSLFVVKNPAAFRQRSTGPRAGQYCYCVGPYDGRLSARGEVIELRKADDTVVASYTIPATPTPLQNALRVTEILFKPLPATAAELAVDPALYEDEFEFVELMNTGTETLNLGGAQFIKGISFTFPPAANLAPGARTLLVANQAAFLLRHPGITNIAGEYSGRLDNAGERLELLDAGGETILDFDYNDKWYPPADGMGYSLVLLDPPATPWNEWDRRTRWGISSTSGGTPGTAHTALGMCYEFWQNTAFTPAQRDDPAISGAAANPDGDELDNLLTYACGGVPALSIVSSSGQQYMALTFKRWKYAADLGYVLQVSDTPGLWEDSGVLHNVPIDNGDGTETVTLRDTRPRNSAPRLFARLLVKLNE